MPDTRKYPMPSDVDENDRRVVLSPEQKREIAKFQGLGFTYSEARWQVLTQEQKQDLLRQIRDAELRRYEKNPYREIIMKARQSAMYRRRRDGELPENEFTITEDDLDWPTHCPALGIELHYRGHFHQRRASHVLGRELINVRGLGCKVRCTPNNDQTFCSAANAAMCHQRPSLRRKKAESLFVISDQPP
jgi:hypothetical protein